MFRIVLTALFLLVFPFHPAMAQNSETYTVRDVRVDTLAESAVKARNQAFILAQEKAFRMLAARFIAPEAVAAFQSPSAAEISGMVSDFEITGEQQSKKRYLANYIFRFKPSSVNRFFGHGPLAGAAVEAEARQTLIVPIFIQNGKSYLWDKANNPWLSAWQLPTRGGSAIIVPQANMTDQMDIRDPAVEKITRSGLKRIQARYGADDIAIATATFDPNAENILTLSLYRTDRGRTELTQTVPVPRGSATKLGELLSAGVTELRKILSENWRGYVPPAQPIYGDTAPASSTSPVPAITTASAAAVAAAPRSGEVTVSTRFTNMADWLATRRSLNGVDGLRSVRILGLTTNAARMQIGYSDWAAMTSGLASRGLSLVSTGAGTYELTRGGRR